MCGIVGYVGNKQVVPLIIDGLRKLEYRGYDSAGIAVVDDDHHLSLRRAEGKLRNLEESIRLNPLDGNYGIGHTRWATHGRPTEENAHPHRDQSGKVVVVHNGIIENYLTLKERLQADGHKFYTETDTEVVAHLIGHYVDTEGLALEPAVRKTVAELKGIFALAIISVDEPDTIIAVREGPPVVIGMGDGEYFVASDIPPILAHTRDVFFLGDREIAILTKDSVRVTDFDGNVIEPEQQRITWDPIMAEKGGFKHFMLKEIYEQPRAVRDTVQGRVSLDTGKVYLEPMDISEDEFRNLTSIKIAACGTSWHAGLAGKYMLESLARIPVDVDYASEFRYRDPVLSETDLLIVISQSGETADTIAAMREAKLSGCKVLAICNVHGSMITREADGTILTHAGPEIGVASTKAFTAQMIAVYLFALYLGEVRGKIDEPRAKKLAQDLAELPLKIEQLLNDADLIEELSKEFFRVQDFLYLGRGINFPVALEGALKLKEISYIHAEGYPAGEMKHGPNALIDEKLPVVVVNTKETGNAGSELRYEKTHSNIVEVKSRDGIIISVLTEGDTMSSKVSSHVIEIPETSDLLGPILSIVPLQLLSYHIAVRRGCDVDQPRNLAKSVTVE
ncbi:MAG TPA: glutamine--fructose-6-phosphate transaminase (isomerizing) [Pyrinomonadaceae bacterium]|nr:glutamine--fructose-6-phosphate transaminase (isomerizing) [Chloracidobacterium sp.]MBP9936248.1 glutamine--fructose-6-phosphate transaminase (isomerizing) [Pyrinomonadaceae bacterium]MBK9437083.1 glutamine--fructose-6-phosphate transaminase (isomerizing) [Chloracidobacterium sp.]MBL0239756.1 glutamine--fructose-6-phosphate transaminase (isomerizing) [Chloracidobacterium sp.]HQX55011.1 glutamine--fructose-6-phosphate transaminase (isomerizing) [Pyrinomonadaceae bacterium]